MSSIGATALWFALLTMVASVVVFARRHRAAWVLYAAATAGVSVGVGTLVRALVQHDFSLRYVALNSSAMLDTQPAVTALWAASAGSLLWCITMVALSGLVAAMIHARRASTSLATATTAGVVAIGLGALTLSLEPFARLLSPPDEGRGLDPQLLHQGMLWQPPLMWLGLAVVTVPFAFTVARWFRANADDAANAEWRGVVQRWVIVAWCITSVALLVGCWWAQQQLGWFGFFFTWEPYASAPILTWLALSALLFVLVSGVDRSSDPTWLAAFVAFTFLLAVSAVIRARGGIAASIRAVDASPSIFLVAMVALGLALLAATGWSASRKGTATGATARAGIGGMLVLVGVLAVSVSLAASHWRTNTTGGFDIGQATELRDPFGATWRFTSQGLSSYQEPAYTVMAVALNATRDGRRVGLLNSQRRQYFDAHDNELYEPVTRVGSRRLLHETVTLGFLGPINRTSAAVRISFVPLVQLLWLGAIVTVLGAVVAAWPTEPLPKSNDIGAEFGR